MSASTRHFRLGHKLATLGVIASLMCALPLYRVLDLQDGTLAALRRAEAGIDPLRTAGQVQRGLLSHRSLAADALRGTGGGEPARRAQAGEVDRQIARLRQQVEVLSLPPARSEAAQLDGDWRVLDARLRERRIELPASEAAHALLLEQTLQVMDLVLLDGRPQAAAAMAPLVATLHRATATTAAASPPARRDAAWQRHDEALRALAARLAEERRGLERQRATLLTTMAVLAGLAVVVGASLRRPRLATPVAPDREVVAERREHTETRRLLDRVRAAPPATRPAAADTGFGDDPPR